MAGAASTEQLDAPAAVRIVGRPPPGESPESPHTGDVRADRSVCPYYHEAVELIGKRWTGAVLIALLAGPTRFSEISASIPQISDRLLSSRLRELEAHGIVARRVLEGSPVHVEYELTGKGRALEPALRSLRVWAREWLKPAAA